MLDLFGCPFDYQLLGSTIAKYGDHIPSRYGDTMELGQVVVRTLPTLRPLRQGMNSRIGWAELTQLLGGQYDATAIAKAAPNSRRHLFNAQMAYGPRVVGQVQGVLDELAKNLFTRRGVVMIARHDDSPTPGPELDMPCTLSAQFIFRGGKLHSIWHMRSWDILKGLPYDLVMFGGLHQAVAQLSNLAQGELHVTAVSCHAYIKDLEAGMTPMNQHQRWFLRPRDTWSMHVRAAQLAMDPAKWHDGRPGIVREAKGDRLEVRTTHDDLRTFIPVSEVNGNLVRTPEAFTTTGLGFGPGPEEGVVLDDLEDTD